ncbi:MAG TPA: Nramp family divalent metal transporter [Ferruginibacter sp.]|nr:Nramp family divalent metal transporter [Ferruginibacter sp.]HRE64365.1 Nramp family divalent metal transporter [Ferruginibacter sp.]
MRSSHHHSNASLSEVHNSVPTSGKGNKWRRLFSFLGPAYLVSVGYMDPGNWATDLAGGSQFGYSLIWVLLMSNIMALLLQSLSSRLGIVRGLDLAQANRATYSKPVNFILYLLAEVAIAATDLAEVLGMAIGIQLLTGMPLIWGVSITVLDTFLLLYLQKLGMRKMEAFIITLVAFIAVCFLVQIIMAKPEAAEIAKGFVPSLPNDDALYIAIGIIGATVMPHNLYLHSALVQTRKIEKSTASIKQALKYNFVDTAVALNVAFLVNAAILILAASVFFKSGNTHVAEIQEAYKLLPGFLGDTAPILFALALIAAGQSSTVTGTLAGQIVMEGYLSLRLNPILRRLVTRLIAIIPAIIVILIYGEQEVNSLLVMSQVVLSLQLGYAIIPLIHFVSDKKTMGEFAIKPFVRIAAWLIASILVFLNLKMLLNEVMPILQGTDFWPKALVIGAGLFFGAILFYIILHPYIAKIKQQKDTDISMHNEPAALVLKKTPEIKKIAVALDFSSDDSKLISYAIAQGKNDCKFLLLHIVESAGAGLLGKETSDFEARKDIARLENYVQQLKEKGYTAYAEIGYKSRVKEIVRIVKDGNADLLVIGAHGHKGLKDFIYGETVNAVRHELNIPILVVTL